MNTQEQMQQIGHAAKQASRHLARLSSRKKNSIIGGMADALEEHRAAIQEANAKDLVAGKEAGLATAMLDRLKLNDARIDDMIKGLHDVAV